MWIWNTFTFLQIKMPLIFCVGLPPQRFVSVSLNLTMQSSQFLAFWSFSAALLLGLAWPSLPISKTFHSNHAPTSSTFPTEFKFEINPRPRNKWQCNNYTRLRISLLNREEDRFYFEDKKNPFLAIHWNLDFYFRIYIYLDVEWFGGSLMIPL